MTEQTFAVFQPPPVSTYGDYSSYMQAVTQYYSQPAAASQAYSSKVDARFRCFFFTSHLFWIFFKKKVIPGQDLGINNDRENCWWCEVLSVSLGGDAVNHTQGQLLPWLIFFIFYCVII